jgi:proteasome assembly chaperone (PAC2) family protein
MRLKAAMLKIVSDYGATSIKASGGTGTPSAKDRRIAAIATTAAPATNLKSDASGA